MLQLVQVISQREYNERTFVACHQHNFQLSVQCPSPQFWAFLFLIYINDLHRHCNSSEVYWFADDPNLTSFDCLGSEVDEDLSKISNWLNGSKLAQNLEKTLQMTIGKSNSNPNYLFVFNSVVKNSSFKYVGVF